jgi:ferredoxin-NADP reductase
VNDRTAGWFPAKVARTVMLAPSARSIELEVDGWPGSVPGQHVDVRLTAEDGYQAVRSYSLANRPDHRPELAVERLADGEVSPFLVDSIAVADEIEVRGPLGGWFVWTADHQGPIQLIGGGSGVVPLIAMLRQHESAGIGQEMRLLYSVRSPEDAFYMDELDAANTVDVSWQFTRSAPADWPYPAERLTDARVAELVVPPEQQPRIYVCGPTGFVESVIAALGRLGHAALMVRAERFGGF